MALARSGKCLNIHTTRGALLESAVVPLGRRSRCLDDADSDTMQRAHWTSGTANVKKSRYWRDAHALLWLSRCTMMLPTSSHLRAKHMTRMIGLTCDVGHAPDELRTRSVQAIGCCQIMVRRKCGVRSTDASHASVSNEQSDPMTGPLTVNASQER